MTREEVKYIDAFKYWCETNEENGVITLPKFLCEHIVAILDDIKERPHGEWKPSWNNLNESYCSHCNFTVRNELRSYFCPKCGSDNRKEGEAK